MGGLEPTGEYVLELLRVGKSVVTANKQLVARRGAELFAAAAEGGVQLRFEASVCAAIPVIKVLREALVANNVHRVLGIVNGTTNFVLTRMEAGADYAEALAEAQSLGYAEADPTEDVSGADAAAKIAILATVAFGSRVTLVGTTGTGFLQNDACWRTLPRLPPGDVRSPFYLHVEVEDRPGVLAHIAERIAAENVSIARLTQRQLGDGASLDVVTHDAAGGKVANAVAAIADIAEVHAAPTVMPVIAEAGS